MKTIHEQLERVYTEERVAVYHTALAFLHDAAAAEDVMQEVFLAFWRELERGSRVRHRRAWLLTVTRNRCRNLLRDGSREEPVEELPVKEAADPVADMVQQETVRQALAALTGEERLAFSLHYLDGYTYREIAAGLDVPMGTVQTRCRIARKKLHAALQESEREEALV